MKRLPLALLLVFVPLIGCGSDDATSGTSGGDAVELTKRLPPDALSYVAVDFDRMRDEGLIDPGDPIYPPPPDAEPLVGFGVGAATSVLAESSQAPEVLDALDLGSASAAAASSGDAGPVAAIATSKDPGEIEADLEKLGWSADGAILVSDDEKEDLVFSIGEGEVLVGASADALERAPDEPLAEVPERLLERADGVVVSALLLRQDCLQATAEALRGDGTGTLLYRVTGEPDPDNLNIEQTESTKFEEPEVEGDTVAVDATGEPDALAIRNTVQQLFLSYDCG